MIVGVVLAAGLGSRFGGDKLLHGIPIQQGTAKQGTANQVAQFSSKSTIAMGLQSAFNLAPYVDEVVCVVRPEDKILAELFKQHGFKVCVSENYQAGLSASLMAGVQASLGANMWWIALGDMPFIKAASYQMIQKQVALQIRQPEHSQKIIRPYTLLESAHKYGHPVIFPKRLKKQLLSLSGDEGAREILKKERHEVLQVLVDDGGIHLDIDEKSDLL